MEWCLLFCQVPIMIVCENAVFLTGKKWALKFVWHCLQEGKELEPFHIITRVIYPKRTCVVHAVIVILINKWTKKFLNSTYKFSQFLLNYLVIFYQLIKRTANFFPTAVTSDHWSVARFHWVAFFRVIFIKKNGLFWKCYFNIHELKHKNGFNKLNRKSY